MTADTLISLLSNGNGSWFGQCRWCCQSSPAVPVCDDLRVLAAAKAAGWTVRDEAGRYVIVCRPCTRIRYSAEE